MIQVTLPIEDSFLVICPVCYDVWARLTGTDTSMWYHRYVPCVAHPEACFPYGCWIAGTLLELDLETKLIDVLPEPLIRREFELTLSSLPQEPA
jgi:hypothetical protein